MISVKSKQQGLVLFIALIALVVMSLAAVALIRSVDTNSLITGNLSYRQTAIISSSYGVEALGDAIGSRARNFNEATSQALGYYATCTAFDPSPLPAGATPCIGTRLTDEASWQAGRIGTATGVGLTNGVDAYGNTIEYIVERMCNATGLHNDTNCLLATVVNEGSSKSGDDASRAGGPTQSSSTPLYRATIRITGPKNTISYIQTFIS